ncbi:MAG: hypothetical protein H6718_03215 [Polyangiaceae bacterium]|nr:hypothetical protein [Myxococcales bacterium]MCB9584376.1 hypothetical protein [Polyangiaceae bacterium]
MPRGKKAQQARGTVIPFPGPRPKPAVSLALIEWQAKAYLADMRPLFERPEVRRGLFRALRLLNPKTQTGRAIRQMLVLFAQSLEQDSPEAVRDWIRGRIIAGQREIIAGLKSGAARRLSGDFEVYRTEKKGQA